jgi:hypothetical protein
MTGVFPDDPAPVNRYRDQKPRFYNRNILWTDNPADVIDYAKNVLGSESKIVNWLDEGERAFFLNERRQVADAA